jgi:hypothetical protein
VYAGKTVKIGFYIDLLGAGGRYLDTVGGASAVTLTAGTWTHLTNSSVKATSSSDVSAVGRVSDDPLDRIDVAGVDRGDQGRRRLLIGGHGRSQNYLRRRPCPLNTSCRGQGGVMRLANALFKAANGHP